MCPGAISSYKKTPKKSQRESHATNLGWIQWWLLQFCWQLSLGRGPGLFVWLSASLNSIIQARGLGHRPQTIMYTNPLPWCVWQEQEQESTPFIFQSVHTHTAFQDMAECVRVDLQHDDTHPFGPSGRCSQCLYSELLTRNRELSHPWFTSTVIDSSLKL